MRYTVPHYFTGFRCIAGQCPDTCCAGWQIVIDPQSLRKYRKVKGGFRNRLLNAVDWRGSVFRQCNGRCEFLNEENLCDLYTELGEKGLCRTCRLYPRHIEEFENLREVSLSLSCPAAAELILGTAEKVRFLSGEKEGQEETYKDFDFLLFEKLMETREAIIGILQDRTVPVHTRAALVIALGHDFQRRILRNQIFDTEALARRYQAEGAAGRFLTQWKEKGGSFQESYHARKELFEGLGRLEPLRREWTECRERVRERLYGQDAREYWSRDKEFRDALSREGTAGQAEIWTEQILVYFIFTYFCGAVYDGDAFSKVKLAVFSVLVVWELVKYEWMQGRTVEVSLVQEAARRYAREIEHSDLNLIRLEEMFRKEADGRCFIDSIKII